MNTVTKQTITGFLISDIFAIAAIGIDKYAIEWKQQTVLIFSEFVIVPFLMGIISTWFWRNLHLNGRRLFAYATCNYFIAVFLSYIFLKEGFICLLIVSPLIVLFVIAGTYTGNYMFKKNNQTLNVSIVSLLAFVFLADSLSTHQYENEVSDTITVNAPVATVWKNVVAFKRIQAKNKYWMFNIGLPSPVESTVTGYYKGAGRKCIFSNGYVFDEVISVFDPGNNLTFDVTHQPRDPEIMNHLDLVRGQFLLKDNGNGTTTLTGNSWYKLYVFPTWYYDIWAQSITQNVHLRVMAHIKELSEAK